MTTRYAVYFLPDVGTPLEAFGRHWLGRDASDVWEPPAHHVRGFNRHDVVKLLQSPRHYGFHATLKPPFSLAAGQTKESLFQAVDDLAASLSPVLIPPLEAVSMEHFLALVPSASCPSLNRLAARCVAELDGFRARPGEDELERRRSAGLTPTQDRLLLEWGYPFVMEEFRFHLTLTGPIGNRSLQAEVREALEPLLASLGGKPHELRMLSVVEQTSEDEPFFLTRHASFRQGWIPAQRLPE